MFLQLPHTRASSRSLQIPWSLSILSSTCGAAPATLTRNRATLCSLSYAISKETACAKAWLSFAANIAVSRCGRRGGRTMRVQPPTEVIPFRPLVGAPVASLRCRILRPGAASITPQRWITKENLPIQAQTRYKYSCPGPAPLAGFDVATYGRFSGGHRGHTARTWLLLAQGSTEELMGT